LQDRITPLGEIVYLRSVLEFKDQKKESKRDCVLEENLLDVKRLLKNSAFAATSVKQDPNSETGEKRVLLKVSTEPFYTLKNADD
jgi:hypothetical protein